MSILNNTTELQELLEIASSLPDKSSGAELPTLTNEGTASDLLSGKQLINSSGNVVTGTIGSQSAKTITPTTTNQTAVASGLYTTGTVTVKGDSNLVASNIKSGVSIFGVNGSYEGNGGIDTSDATATDTKILSGYTAYVKGSKITGAMPSLSAKTIIPDTTLQIAAYPGYYTNGIIAVEGDANLVPWNIKNGVSIFGVAGNYEGSDGGSSSGGEDKSADLINGNITAWSNTNLSTIRPYAFAECTSLTNVSIPACTYIGSNAFQNCSKLTSANFPACTYISMAAFQYCKSLLNASFPVCSSIGSLAFYCCSNLTSVSFPMCTKISEYAFYGCSKLSGTIEFPKCDIVWGSAFRSCTNLEYVSLPKASYIGSYAFADCTQLRTLSIAGSVFCSLASSNAFQNAGIKSGTGVIYVNQNLYYEYLEDPVWSYFSNIITYYKGYEEDDFEFPDDW